VLLGRGNIGRVVEHVQRDKGAWVAKTKKRTQPSLWKDLPDEHDYPAAYDYLTLLIPEKTARAVVAQLRKAPISHRKAKDILRASALNLLSPDSEHVSKDMKKVEMGILLSPVLLMRAGLRSTRPLIVADGYHRICASHHLDENLDIPCRIADLPMTR
jgi:hypothetical protein